MLFADLFNKCLVFFFAESPDSSEPSETREFICYVSNPKLPEDDPEAVIKVSFFFQMNDFFLILHIKACLSIKEKSYARSFAFQSKR